MNTNLLGLPIALTSLIPPHHSWTLPVKTNQETKGKAVEANAFFKYSLPIETDPDLEILKRLNSISQLRQNWDGYNAVAPEYSVIHNSLAFLRNLPAPIKYGLRQDDLTPTPYGTIVFDFICDSETVSVEIGEKLIGFYTEFINGNDISLESKFYNQDAIPPELMEVFERLYKTNISPRNSN